MWKHKTLIPPLCLVLLCATGEAQTLMELNISKQLSDRGSLDCNISSDGSLNITYWAWLDPTGAELCNNSKLNSGTCQYVPKKQLTLNLGTVTPDKTGNYSCKILCNRGIKSAQVEVKSNQPILPVSYPIVKDNSSSVCGLGLMWVGLLVILLMV